MGGFSRLLIRGRYGVVAIWIAFALACAFLLPDVKSADSGSLGDLVATDADAIEAEKESIALFRFPVLSRTLVVQHDDDGLSPAAEARVYRRAAAITRGAYPGLESIPFAIPLTSDLPGGVSVPGGNVDGRPTTAVTFLFYPPEIGPEGRTGLAERLIARHIDRPGDGDVGLTGAVPARAEQIRAITGSLPFVELATILMVSIAVGLHYRSLGAPLLNIAAVGLVYYISVHLTGGLGRLVGIGVPEEVEPVMVALLFGIVTDYSIFFMSRFRRLLNGRSSGEAATQATSDLLPTIVAAGMSVALASLALVAAQLDFFRAFGPGMAISVLIALAVVTTFVPACLAIAGDRLFWPSPRAPAAAKAARSRLGALVDWIFELPFRRPVLVAVLVSIPLLALALAVTRLELANTLITGLPGDSEPRRALGLVKAGFVPGVTSPVMVLVEDEGIGRDESALRDLQRELEGRSRVASVVGPDELLGSAQNLGAISSLQGDAVRFLLVLDVNPLGSRAIETIDDLKADLPGLLGAAGLGAADWRIAGDSAIAEETVNKTTDDLARVVPLASIAVFLVLAVFLRALVAPLYLVAVSLFALAASLGLTIIVFQYLLGYGELTFYVPFAGIVLLIALGSDYNVYLVGRVWSEARSRPFPAAVRIAASRARQAITVAGLVLAASFALLAIVPLRPFRELAFLLAGGLLIDAFVVRSLLAPALIMLAGERSAWPRTSLRSAARQDRRSRERKKPPQLS
ncbi:MAG: MMPL family transporter [Solirubrobacterales bacterium]